MSLKLNIFTGQFDFDTNSKVRYDSGDPIAGYVANKFVAGTGITLSEGTGADENKLKISNSGVVTETDPLSLHLDQTTPQTVTNGQPIFGQGLKITSGQDIRPSSDSTTAINIAQADGTDWVTFNTTNKRVGIGTTSPSSVLDVVAQDLINAPITITNYQNAGTVVGRRANGTIASPSALASGDLITATLGRGHNGSAFTTTSNGGVYIWAGENWSPTATGTYITLETTPNLSTSRTEKVRITGDGKVGIGTTSPSLSLHVNGGNSDIAFLDSTYNVAGAGSGIYIRNTTPTGSTADNRRNLFFGFTDTSGTMRYMSGIRGVLESVTASTAPAALTFSTGSSTLFERVRIDSNGNVGIGTTSPSAKLDVTQPVNGFAGIFGADVSADSRTNATRKFLRIGMPHYTNAEEPVSLITGDSDGTDNIIGFGGYTSSGNAATSLRFYTAVNNTTTAGTERMRINSSGNVGIGTTSPQALLHVASTDPYAILSDTDAGVDSKHFFLRSSSGRLAIGSKNDSYANLYEAISILNNGTVGIGTTSPDTTLHVSGTSSTAGAIKITRIDESVGPAYLYMQKTTTTPAATDYVGFIRFDSTNSAAEAISYASIAAMSTGVTDSTEEGSLLFTTYSNGTSAERMRIKGANVGIGTTSPEAKLDVSNVAVASTFTADLRLTSTGTEADSSHGIDWYGYGTSWNEARIASVRDGATSGFGLGFSTKANSGALAEWLRITSAGNVGIGTTAPLCKTHISVDGTTASSIWSTSIGALLLTDNTQAIQRIGTATSTVANGSALVLVRSRGTIASPTIISDGDEMGRVVFQGYDGTARINSAQITAEVDGTPGTNDMPGRLLFKTTADGGSTPTERMRIDNAGNVKITADSKYLYFGAGDDASITFTGTSLDIQSDVVTATDELNLRGGTNGIDFLIGATEQINLTDGKLAPTTNSDIDLGDSTHYYKNTYSDRFISQTATASATGPTDNFNVAGVNVVLIDTSSNNVTIGGFVGGVAGQVLYVVRTSTTNSATLEYNEGTGNQDIFLKSEVDETLDVYGGWVLVCNGTNWYECVNNK